MKLLLLCTLLIISSCLHASEIYKVGPVDFAMLKKLIQEKSSAHVHKEITGHTFTKPYVIEQTATKEDGSALSKELFSSICSIFHNTTLLPTEWGYFLVNPKENPLNAASDTSATPNRMRIDYCTIADTKHHTVTLSDNPTIIHLRTEFYDRTSLLAALREISKPYCKLLYNC